MAGLWRPRPLRPERRSRRQFGSGAARDVVLHAVRYGVAPGADAQGRCDGAGSKEIGLKPFGHWLWLEGFLVLWVAGRSPAPYCPLPKAFSGPHQKWRLTSPYFFGEASERRPWA